MVKKRLIKKYKINTYTDESGQDTAGKYFIVVTAIIETELASKLESLLLEIEEKSGKTKKWSDSGNRKRHKYISELLEKNLLAKIKVFYSKFENKSDYISLIGSHIAKSILFVVGNNDYQTKIFLDRINKKEELKLSKEIKSYKIRYKKIRGIRDEGNAFIRLSDAICGLIRDLKNRNCANNYKKIFLKITEI